MQSRSAAASCTLDACIDLLSTAETDAPGNTRLHHLSNYSLRKAITGSSREDFDAAIELARTAMDSALVAVGRRDVLSGLSAAVRCFASTKAATTFILRFPRILRKEAEAAFPRHFTSTYVVRNGADDKKFHAATRSSAAVPTIILSGRLIHYKGVRILLEAMRILQSKGIAAKCQIVGTSGFGNAKPSVVCARAGLECSFDYRVVGICQR